jgi:hypothetical protein
LRSRALPADLPPALIEWLARSRGRAFTPAEFAGVVSEAQQIWPFARRKSIATVTEWLLQNSQLQHVTVRSQLRASAVSRFTWGSPSPYAIALSLAPQGYLSHRTALVLHGLARKRDNEPIYVNREQTLKTTSGSITQDAMDRAFARPQRRSNNVFSWSRCSALIVNGKYTGRLEVAEISTLDGSTAPATTMARTLIDVAVRPDYGGGPSEVLNAYVRAKNRVSTTALADTLSSSFSALRATSCSARFTSRSEIRPTISVTVCALRDRFERSHMHVSGR